MAAIVERPMSALNDLQTPLPPPRRDSIEIIDVDQFEQELYGSSRRPGHSRPSGHRLRAHPDAISVDSDDEDLVLLLSPHLQANESNGNRGRRHFVSTTPREPSVPPPVPPVPHWYAAHMSLPTRRRASPRLDSLPIIPNQQPFDFELSDRSPERPVAGPSNHAQSTVALQPAPPSHHTPAMGLGGALISSNSSQALQRFADQDYPRRLARTARRARPTGRMTPAATQNFAHRSIGPVSIIRDSEDNAPQIVQVFPTAEFHHHFTSRHRHHHRETSAEIREKEQYQPSYTHPQQPEPGFTFDFDVPSTDPRTRKHFFPPTSIDEPIVLDDDDDVTTPGPSSSSGVRETSPDVGKLSAMLVCARCLDPLILNATLDPDEAQLKRVWGLRCGHLIDEKCLNEIGKPSEEKPPVDKKGKGKAKAVFNDPDPPSDPATVENDTGSISSRLRSRLPSLSNPLPNLYAASVAAASSYLSSHPSSTPVAQPSPPKKRRVSKKPKIEAEYEWKCPVASCAQVHVSVKIDGVWGPEKESESPPTKKALSVGAPPKARGAIAVFA